MPARRSSSVDATVETKALSAVPGAEVRSLEVVAETIRAKVAAGEDAEAIQQELAVSPHVFRELLTHSYKMVGRAPEVFEYQERMRIGEIES
jgi:hypothetical protein